MKAPGSARDKWIARRTVTSSAIGRPAHKARSVREIWTVTTGAVEVISEAIVLQECPEVAAVVPAEEEAEVSREVAAGAEEEGGADNCAPGSRPGASARSGCTCENK